MILRIHGFSSYRQGRTWRTLRQDKQRELAEEGKEQTYKDDEKPAVKPLANVELMGIKRLQTPSEFHASVEAISHL